MVDLGGGAVSYERGTPVPPPSAEGPIRGELEELARAGMRERGWGGGEGEIG